MKLWTACVAALACLVTGVAPGAGLGSTPQLLQNPGFEQGTESSTPNTEHNS